MNRVAFELVTMMSISIAAVVIVVLFFYWPTGFASVEFVTQRNAPEDSASQLLDRNKRQFVDVTHACGVSFVHVAGTPLRDIRQVTAPGVGIEDVDGDGLLDLFFPGSPVDGTCGSALFRNLGDMRFERVNGAGGACSGEDAMGCAMADFDNDGDIDIYVTALGPNKLYVNDGRGRFREKADQRGLDDHRWSTAAAWADFDGDGWLDLYVANYLRFSVEPLRAATGASFDRDELPAFSPYVFDAAEDALYRNQCHGDSFCEVQLPAGADPGKGLGVLFADLSGDRRPDILAINDVSSNRFLVNNGDGSFSDVGLVSGLADPRSGMGVAFGDYDGDGLYDIFSTHWQDESNVLYRNLGTPSLNDPPYFDDVTISAGLASISLGLTGWGTCLADFDLDSDLDIVVVNGYTSPSLQNAGQCIGQPALYMRQHAGRFENASRSSGLDPLETLAARGAAAGDLDRDGDLDLVVTTNNGPAFVFENRAERRNYLTVRPDRMAVGCEIVVNTGDQTQRRLLISGSSFLSSEPLEAHFGLNHRSTLESVRVTWSDGASLERAQVSANQVLTVTKPR